MMPKSEDQVLYVLPSGKYRIRRYVDFTNEDGDAKPVDGFFCEESVKCQCLTGFCSGDNHWRMVSNLKPSGISEFAALAFDLLKKNNEAYKQVNREREQALECNEMAKIKINSFASDIRELEPKLKTLVAQISGYNPVPK